MGDFLALRSVAGGLSQVHNVLLLLALGNVRLGLLLEQGIVAIAAIDGDCIAARLGRICPGLLLLLLLLLKLLLELIVKLLLVRLSEIWWVPAVDIACGLGNGSEELSVGCRLRSLLIRLLRLLVWELLRLVKVVRVSGCGSCRLRCHLLLGGSLVVLRMLGGRSIHLPSVMHDHLRLPIASILRPNLVLSLWRGLVLPYSGFRRLYLLLLLELLLRLLTSLGDDLALLQNLLLLKLLLLLRRLLDEMLQLRLGWLLLKNGHCASVLGCWPGAHSVTNRSGGGSHNRCHYSRVDRCSILGNDISPGDSRHTCTVLRRRSRCFLLGLGRRTALCPRCGRPCCSPSGRLMGHLLGCVGACSPCGVLLGGRRCGLLLRRRLLLLLLNDQLLDKREQLLHLHRTCLEDACRCLARLTSG